MMVRPTLSGRPVRADIPLDRRGVASENVVAVAQMMEKMAIMSITLPHAPSTRLPNKGRHASEKR